MFRKLWNAATRTRRDRVNWSRSCRPGLETLEDRCVPAFTWVGGSGGLWSVGSNWNMGFAPTPGSSVQFGSAFGGTNTNSIDNMSGLSLASLDVDTSYGSNTTITLSTSLTVTEEIVQYSGIIATADSSEVLTNDGTFDWYGGTLMGAGTLNNQGYYLQKPSMSIPANFNVDGGQNLGINVLNKGNMNWGDNANIYMFGGAVLTNNPTGIIDITTPGSLIDTGAQGSYFINHEGPYGGKIYVDTDGTVTIGIGDVNPDLNWGIISLTGGNLVFGTGSGEQFTNGGLISDDTGAGGYLTFTIPYYQVTNADDSAYATETGTASGNVSEIFNAGATVNAGLLSCGNGSDPDTVTINSDLTIGTGGRLQVGDASSTLTYATLNVSQDIINNGLASIGSDASTPGSTVINAGTFFNNSTAVLDASAVVLANSCAIDAALVNNGVINPYNLTINGSLTQESGTTNLGGLTVTGADGGSGLFSEIGGVVNIGTIPPGGNLTATGGFVIGASPGSAASLYVGSSGAAFIAANVIDNGTIQFANANYVLSLSIEGNYSQYGNLNVAYSGGSGQSASDVVYVTGTASLSAATINVSGNTGDLNGAIFGPIQVTGQITVSGLTVNPPPGSSYSWPWTVYDLYPNNNPPYLENGIWITTIAS